MKPRFPLATVFVVAAQAIALAQSPAGEPVKPLQTIFLDPDAPEFAEVRALGERAIARAGYSMVAEVSAAVAKSGTVDAVSVCHLKNLPTTGQIVPGLPRVTALKRTSLRLRDPANAPDAADQAALDRVRSALDAGDPPRILIQRLWQPNGATEWRVYRPIAVLPQCMACHGPRAGMLPQLQAELAWRYPHDRAVDYALGEWRGLIRVSIADTTPAAKSP